jgi:phospholipid/cholesterol/gamma-HCH transport system permease protein
MSFLRPSEDTLLVRLSGECTIGSKAFTSDDLQKQIESDPKIQEVTFDVQNLTSWDSGLLSFLIKIMDLCSKSKIALEQKELPEGVQRLLALATCS